MRRFQGQQRHHRVALGPVVIAQLRLRRGRRTVLGDYDAGASNDDHDGDTSTMNNVRHDLYGREVDGFYWLLLEESFEDCALRYRASGNELAASIADRLAETVDDVPAQVIQVCQDLWDVVFDYPDGQSPADLITDEMMDSLACGYSPNNATAFALEFIRRMTGTRAQ
jgi:hypothetical protein